MQLKARIVNLRLTSAKKARNQEKRDGRTLTLAFKGGEKTTSVPEGIPIVTLRRSHRDLKPGAAVFVPAQRDSRGALCLGVRGGQDERRRAPDGGGALSD